MTRRPNFKKKKLFTRLAHCAIGGAHSELDYLDSYTYNATIVLIRTDLIPIEKSMLRVETNEVIKVMRINYNYNYKQRPRHCTFWSRISRRDRFTSQGVTCN